MIYSLLIFLFVNSYFCFIIGGHRLISPSFLVNLTLLISSALYAFSFSFFIHDISLFTFLVVIIGVLVFEVGELFSTYVVALYRRCKSCGVVNDFVVVPNSFYYFSLIFVLIVTVMNYNYFMTIGESMGGASNVFAAYAIARVYYNSEANLENVEIINKPSYLTVADIMASAIAYLFLYYFFYNTIICKKNAKKYLCPILLYLPTFFFSTGRMSFATFLILCLTIYAFLNYRKFRSSIVNLYIIKVGIVVFVVSIILFRVTGLIRGGAFLENTNNVENSSVLEDLSVYVAAPIYGLDYYLNNCYGSDGDSNRMVGQNTLSGIYQSLRLLGFDIPDYPKHQKFFHWANGSSNVYTGFKTDIQDYSIFGASIYILILGFVCGFMYRYGFYYRNIVYSPILLIVLGKLYYPIIFYFYVDDFYSLTNVNFVILLFSLFLFNKIFLKFNVTSDEGNTGLSKSSV